MSGFARIGLGTVQFGLSYGVSNVAGQPSDREITSILSGFAAAGGRYIDTAVSYGNAEARIGAFMPALFAPRIASKLPAIHAPAFTADVRDQLIDAISGSLNRLKIDKLHAILLHNAADIGKPGWQYLLDALHEAKARGMVSRIGASVYDADEMELVERRISPDIVQLPMSCLDRRLLASGWLSRLKAKNTEIHVRSVFLQGLLLMAPDALPAFFAPAKPVLADMSARWMRMGVTPLAGCLGFALAQKEIDVVVVGVTSALELGEIKDAVAQVDNGNIDFGAAPEIDSVYLDPRRWPPASH